MTDFEPFEDLDDANAIFKADNTATRKYNSALLIRSALQKLKKQRLAGQGCRGWRLSLRQRKSRPVTLATKPFNPEE